MSSLDQSSKGLAQYSRTQYGHARHSNIPLTGTNSCPNLFPLADKHSKKQIGKERSVWLPGPDHRPLEEVREGTQAGAEAETTESSCLLLCFLKQPRPTIYSRACLLTSINLKLETLSHPETPLLGDCWFCQVDCQHQRSQNKKLYRKKKKKTSHPENEVEDKNFKSKNYSRG